MTKTGYFKEHFMKSILTHLMKIGIFTSLGWTQLTSVQSESGLEILFGGEIETEFVDVEGPGGFTNQDLTYNKVKNRSPHMRIDKAVLSTRINYSKNLYYKFELRFGDKRANVDKHYARWELPSFRTLVELGKNKPMIATKRQTEGYPLIGTAFWKGREYHITSKTQYKFGENIEADLGLSFAMKRPLGTDDAAEDKSFKMMVYNDYEDRDGQTFEYGGSLGLKVFGVSADGWYYTGKLIDDYDWKYNLGFLPGYDNIAESKDEWEEDDKTHWWYGGRVGVDRKNIHIRVEYINALDGLLPRNGFYVEGSYRIPLKQIKSVEPLIRFGNLNILRHEETMGDPQTWDREMITLAFLLRLNDYLTVKTEYYFLNEITGGSKTTDNDGNIIDNTFVKDNQFLLQLKFEF
tara:strand:+ start:1469 stop:2686 length:1218 start_codon:yes stop_codon:yes gene_type:complete